MRLFDLVKSKDAKFLNAFYFALRDTLVAENITVGTKIAFSQEKNYRVVTLNGDLVEITGVMSGGGKPKSGLIGSRLIEEYSDRQIQQIEQQV